MIRMANRSHLLTIIAGRGGQPVGGCRCGWSSRTRLKIDEIVDDYDRHLRPAAVLPPTGVDRPTTG